MAGSLCQCITVAIGDLPVIAMVIAMVITTVITVATTMVTEPVMHAELTIREMCIITALRVCDHLLIVATGLQHNQ